MWSGKCNSPCSTHKRSKLSKKKKKKKRKKEKPSAPSAEEMWQNYNLLLPWQTCRDVFGTNLYRWVYHLCTDLLFSAHWIMGNIMRITRLCTLICLPAMFSQNRPNPIMQRAKKRQVCSESATYFTCTTMQSLYLTGLYIRSLSNLVGSQLTLNTVRFRHQHTCHYIHYTTNRKYSATC